jgi:hypothetical protein
MVAHLIRNIILRKTFLMAICLWFSIIGICNLLFIFLFYVVFYASQWEIRENF